MSKLKQRQQDNIRRNRERIAMRKGYVMEINLKGIKNDL